MFSSPEVDPRCLLISSAGPQEGKTITVANLAVTMAQFGSRVILLDCDLRRPKLHKLFSMRQNLGVTNLLVGQGRFKIEELATDMPNLYILPSGPVPPNPSELLGSIRMRELLHALRDKFDRILIDSPPIAAVTDAVVLAKHTDGVVFVSRAYQTVRGAARNSLEQLQAIGTRVLGVVLNGVDITKDRYYTSHYYYYYYGEEDRKRPKAPHKNRKRNPNRVEKINA
jgi:capsular exopolysaccharide synthesis family protein